MQKKDPIVAPTAAEPRASAMAANGSFVATVTKVVTRFPRAAAAVEGALIVIAPEGCPRGHRVTSLAATSRAPVLVPRRTPANGTILAATDLESDCPVLHLAAALAWKFQARLVVLHNVAPLSLLPVSAAAGQGLVWPERTPVLPDPARAWRTESLRRACQWLPVQPLPIVREEISVSDAITSEARARSADLIVVGARRRNWLQRLLSEGVAARMVDQAECSVLVAPAAAACASGSARRDHSFDASARLEVSC